LKTSKKSQLLAWIAQHGPGEIGELEFQALLAALSPISFDYLRRLLRDTAADHGIPLSPMIEGVRQSSFEDLRRTLVQLSELYEQEGEQVQRRGIERQKIRELVITAKDHARLALRGRVAPPSTTTDDARERKQEMLLWLLTWLENPPLFPQWVAIRARAVAHLGGSELASGEESIEDGAKSDDESESF
jgi:hypothetical protein